MKTVEEAAKQYAEEAIPKATAMGIKLREYAKRDFIAGVEFAQKWIPIKNPPEVGEIVLFKNKFEEVSTGYYAGMYFDIHSDDMTDWDVNHWRPIELK